MGRHNLYLLVDPWRSCCSPWVELGLGDHCLHQTLPFGKPRVPLTRSALLLRAIGRVVKGTKIPKKSWASAPLAGVCSFQPPFFGIPCLQSRLGSSCFPSCECRVAVAPRGGRSCGADKEVTWLILPVVICLSQRLSHACLSINNFIL